MCQGFRGGAKGFWILFLVLAAASRDVSALAATGRARSKDSSSQTNRLLILGLGRVGLECGLRAADADSTPCSFDQVMGTVRSSRAEEEDLGDPIVRIPFENLEDPIKEASHILWTIPLSKENNETLEDVLQLLQSTNEHLAWIGMISTTGIYGNHNGAWVTEDSPLLCTRESNADLYRSVEQRFAAMGGQIFRCAGIYDATRSALHTVYEAGTRPVTNERSTDRNDESITNRIHSQDIARAIVLSMSRPTRNTFVYNLADDEPAPRSLVLDYAADLLESIGVPLVGPPTGSPSENNAGFVKSTQRPLTKRERRRQADRKLVSNSRMKDELLGPSGLAFPTYREGLQAILKDPTTPWQQTQAKRVTKT